MFKTTWRWLVGLMVLAFIAALTVGAANPVTDAVNGYFAKMPADIYKISEKDFVAKVKAQEPMVILDIRQPDVYAKGHIRGAINLPWGTAISDNLEKLPKDRLVMVYCYTGQTAGQTVALLNMAGFNAKSVNLGWDFGISKVEGVQAVMDTEAAFLSGGSSVSVNAAIKTEIERYFQGLNAVKGTKYVNYKISEAAAQGLLDQKASDIQFVSVRSAADYAKGHIDGAINIPFGKGMEQQFTQLPKDKKLIVYCYTGQTAGQTVAGLRMLGYDAVSLNGGIGTPANAPQGWANQGYPLVK